MNSNTDYWYSAPEAVPDTGLYATRNQFPEPVHISAAGTVDTKTDEWPPHPESRYAGAQNSEERHPEGPHTEGPHTGERYTGDQHAGEQWDILASTIQKWALQNQAQRNVSAVSHHDCSGSCSRSLSL